MAKKTYRKFSKKGLSKKNKLRKGKRKSLRSKVKNRKHWGGENPRGLDNKDLELEAGYTIFLVNHEDAQKLLVLEYENLADYWLDQFSPYLYYINFPINPIKDKEKTSILKSPAGAFTIDYHIDLGKKYKTKDEFLSDLVSRKDDEGNIIPGEVYKKIQTKWQFERDNSGRKYFPSGKSITYKHSFHVTITKVMSHSQLCFYTIEEEERKRIIKMLENEGFDVDALNVDSLSKQGHPKAQQNSATRYFI